jgi:hypothetical protein
MNYEFTHRPSYTHLIVQLQAGESIKAEPGAMVGHSTTVSMQTESSGDGLLGSAKSVLGGESAFVNQFTAEGGPGQVTLAPPSPGDVMSHELTGRRNRLRTRRYQVGHRRGRPDTARAEGEWNRLYRRLRRPRKARTRGRRVVHPRQRTPDRLGRHNRLHHPVGQRPQIQDAGRRGAGLRVHRPGNGLVPEPRPERVRLVYESTHLDRGLLAVSRPQSGPEW